MGQEGVGDKEGLEASRGGAEEGLREGLGLRDALSAQLSAPLPPSHTHANPSSPTPLLSHTPFPPTPPPVPPSLLSPCPSHPPPLLSPNPSCPPHPPVPRPLPSLISPSPPLIYPSPPLLSPRLLDPCPLLSPTPPVPHPLPSPPQPTPFPSPPLGWGRAGQDRTEQGYWGRGCGRGGVG